MTNLFFGYLFILLNVTVTLFAFSFDVLADFVGFFILAKTSAELGKQNEYFQKTVLPCRILAGVTLATWVVFGIGALGNIPFLGTVKSVILLAEQVAMVAVIYFQVKGIGQIEEESGYYMKAFNLRSDWMVLAVACVLSSVSIYGFILQIAMWAKLIFAVKFLLDLNYSIKAYTEKTERPAEKTTPTADDGSGTEAEISFTAEESGDEEEEL